MMSATRLKHGLISVSATLTLLACAGRVGPLGVEIVTRRPPPDRVEVVGVSPGTGYYYIRGHWGWQGGDYVLISGRWERPPRPEYRRWIAGHWVKARNGWYWEEGHWG